MWGDHPFKVCLVFSIKVALSSLRRTLQILCKRENVREGESTVCRVVYENEAEERHLLKD